MQTTVEQACPRCFQALKVVRSTDGAHRTRVSLVCAEPYCDYVLALTEREVASFRSRWPWITLGWFTRAAS